MKKLDKKQVEKLIKMNQHFDKTVRSFCFHELKSEYKRDKIIHLKNEEIDLFFDNSDYDKIYTSIELFNQIINKVRLDFREDPYVPVNKCFCIKENQYDEIIVDDFSPYKNI
jgi:hypothetical protein